MGEHEMPVAVGTKHAYSLPRAAPARLVVGGAKQSKSSPHTPADLLAADRRGEFLAMVSHELKNSLASILSGVEFARDTEGLLPQPEWLWTGLENATRQVEGLLADLMELCQASHPTFRLQKRPMELTSAVCAAAARRRSDFDRLGLSLALEVGAEAVWVNADPDRLELVLGNLLDNAAKYTEPGGLVTVSIETTSAEVELRVRDTGIGIAPEVLPFVFEPFMRDTTPAARPRRGSGIGLLLVRTLVESHGGRVEASSAGRGRGSEFVVFLPVMDSQSITLA
jgi:signal transduction histidine kinase